MQAVSRFGITETPERSSFIRDNWKTMSDEEMGNNLNLCHQAIGAYRCWMGLYRQKHNTLSASKKAVIAEMFFTEYSLKEIVKVTGHTYYTVSKFITYHMLFKRLSDKTKVITMKSKV